MSPKLTGTTVKTLDIYFNCTHPLDSTITMNIGSNSLDGENLVPLKKGFIEGNKIDVMMGASAPYIELVSIDPQEDDNYIYKPFSTHLKKGDNGEFGKNLYQYLVELRILEMG